VLLGVALLWGSTFIVTKDLLGRAPPLAFLALRFSIAALVLAMLNVRRFPVPRATLRAGIVLGLLNSSGLLLQVFGQLYTTASKSAFITSLNTPLTPIVALLVYRARASRPQLVGVILATCGLLLLTWPGTGVRWNPGDLLTIGCAAVYAFTIAEIARRSPGHHVGLLTTVQIATAAALFVAVYLGARLLGVPMRAFVIDLHIGWEVAYMALVCTVVTFAGQTWAMSRMSATRAAIIFATEPVFATALAVAVAGASEWPGPRGAMGAGLVLAGVVASEYRSS
jgi:drug/metabolite transporter (DMT)-like permease